MTLDDAMLRNRSSKPNSSFLHQMPECKRCCTHILSLMLGQHRRRWVNVTPSPVTCVVFTQNWLTNTDVDCFQSLDLNGFSDPGNTKHVYNICTMSDQRRRRWVDVVQMLYKCFVFAEEEYMFW